MFIYKFQPRFHRFHDHSQPHIEPETHSLDLNRLFNCLGFTDYIKILLIFDFVTLREVRVINSGQ